MVPAARALLSSVTRVLLLADMIVVKQIIAVKKHVRSFVYHMTFVNTKSYLLLRLYQH
jgi:hypothetical protein